MRARRLSGGTVFGGCLRGGSAARRSVLASVMIPTARSKASSVAADVFCTPLILRTYCRAAASISSGVASGSRPRRVVMFRHMAATLPSVVEADPSRERPDRTLVPMDLAEPLEAARSFVERSVRGAVSGSAAPPELTWTPDDPGLFGPDSATWQVHGDPAGLVGGLRSLLFQTTHPLAMAGVADHSTYRHDPLGRLHRTADFIRTTTYGSTPDAEAAIDTVRTIHRRVVGTAPDGRRYAANDPHLLEWVHITEVDSFLRAHQRYGQHPLSADDADRYVAEMAVVGEKLGVVAAPRSVAELDDRIERYRPELSAGRQARDTVRFLLVPPLPLAARPTYAIILGAAIGLLPRYVRRMLWLPLAPRADPLVVRPAAQATPRVFGWALRPRAE